MEVERVTENKLALENVHENTANNFVVPESEPMRDHHPFAIFRNHWFMFFL